VTLDAWRVHNEPLDVGIAFREPTKPNDGKSRRPIQPVDSAFSVVLASGM